MTEPLRFHLQVAPNRTSVQTATPRAAVETNPVVRAILAVTQGAPGSPGQPGGTVSRVTAAALSGHRVVTTLDDGTVNYADATNPDHLSRPMWLTTGAWGSGVTATLVSDGPVVEPTWAWTPGQPIYLGANGALTQTEDPGAAFVLIVAEVIDATTISFRPQVPIVKG